MNQSNINNKKYLILNSDDLGTQYSGNAGIYDAATKGFLTSVSVRANGVAFKEACREILPACPELGVGVHICLNEGKCAAPQHLVPALAAEDGTYRCEGGIGFAKIAFNLSSAFHEQVRADIRAQIEAVLKETKRKIDHIDGHQHIHMIPWIFKITAGLAREYNIPYIRLSKEPFIPAALQYHKPHLINIAHYVNIQRYCIAAGAYLKQTGLLSNNTFFGLLHTSAMTEDVTSALLADNPRRGITEVLCHPARQVEEPYYLNPGVEQFYKAKARSDELAACLSEKVKKAINADYILTNYNKLAKIRQEQS